MKHICFLPVGFSITIQPTRAYKFVFLQKDPYPMDYLEGRIIDEDSTL